MLLNKVEHHRNLINDSYKTGYISHIGRTDPIIKLSDQHWLVASSNIQKKRLYQSLLQHLFNKREEQRGQKLLQNTFFN